MAAMAISANATTITFDALPTGDLPANVAYTEGIYTITAFASSGGTVEVVDLGGARGNVIEDNNAGDFAGTSFRVTRTDGGIFSVDSIDVGNTVSGYSTDTTCSGGSGGVVKLTSNLGDCATYGPTSGFSTYSPSGFENISYLNINIVNRNINFREYAVDNLNLTATPEPSTIFMALSGLAFVANGFRRRRG
jgi:hypothetical protein